ncbi:MAG: LPS export ABC transporter permease LptG [Candidatus Omnitrophota bacterium]
MRILDRYILRTLIPAFLLCIFIFMFLYVLIDLFTHLDEILKQNVSLIALKDYYLNFLPLIFVQTAPVASLLAVVWTLGQLNRQNEIIAIRAAGLSVWQIIKSILFFGLLLSIVTFILNEKVIPPTQAKIAQIKEESFKPRGEKSKNRDIKNLSVFGLDNRLFFARNFNASQNKLEGIIILEQDQNQNLLSKIVAEVGSWQDNNWVFYKCIIYRFNEIGQLKGEPEYFEKTIMKFPETPRDFIKQNYDISFMDMKRLKDYIKRLSKGGATAALRNFKVDYHNRISLPFTSLVIMFIGIPFSLYIRSRVTILSSLGICIGISFLYFVLNAVSLALGKSGFLSPVLSAWSPQILFGLVALFLINRLP